MPFYIGVKSILLTAELGRKKRGEYQIFNEEYFAIIMGFEPPNFQ